MTTSLQVSKDLAAIRFKSKEVFFYDKRGDLYFIKELDYDKTLEIDCIAFDLETILNALPKNIKLANFFLTKLKICFDEDGNDLESSTYIGYQNFQGFYQEHTEKQIKGESLADTAGRLLIDLVKKGIINFKK